MIKYNCEKCGEPVESPANLAFDVCPKCDHQNNVDAHRPRKRFSPDTPLALVVFLYILILGPIAAVVLGIGQISPVISEAIFSGLVPFLSLYLLFFITYKLYDIAQILKNRNI